MDGMIMFAKENTYALVILVLLRIKL